MHLATDAILYPTKCEYLSFDGLIESFTHRDMMQSTRARWGLSNIQVMGIVPVMYRAGTLVHQENLNKLKEKYGDRLVFWGGGVDTQKVLPFAKPSEVKEHVLKECEIFATNGGFVFNTVHNIQANVPLENVLAMLDAIKEFS